MIESIGKVIAKKAVCSFFAHPVQRSLRKQIAFWYQSTHHNE